MDFSVTTKSPKPKAPPAFSATKSAEMKDLLFSMVRTYIRGDEAARQELLALLEEGAGESAGEG